MAVWGNLAIVALNVLLKLLPSIFANAAKRAEYERLVKASIYIWEKRTGRAVKLRQDHREVDEKLEGKWRERWGGGSPRPPSS